MPLTHAYQVIECPFNREYYPELIGRFFKTPPPYAATWSGKVDDLQVESYPPKCWRRTPTSNP